MSVISLTTAKSFLDVIHNADDTKLNMLLDGAEDEAMRFMNRTSMDEWDSDVSSDPLPPSVVVGVLLLLQATYDAGPDDAAKLRMAAEVKLMPYRVEMGV